MDPLRKRFYVNGEPVAASTLHAPYVHVAHVLLDMVKQRMQMGNLQQLAQRYVTEDGAILTALSRHGQDEIRIDVPATSKRKGGKAMREYCVWRPDREIYADIPYLNIGLQLPVMDSKKRVVFVRGGDTWTEFLRICKADDLSLEQIFTYEEIDPSLEARGNVAVDVMKDRFFIESVDEAITFTAEGRTPIHTPYSFDNSGGQYNHANNAGAFYTLSRVVDTVFSEHALFDSETMQALAIAPHYFASSTDSASGFTGGFGHSAPGGSFTWEVRTIFGASPVRPYSINIIPLTTGSGPQTRATVLPLPGRLVGVLSTIVVAENSGQVLWAWFSGQVDGTSDVGVELWRFANDEWKPVALAGVNDADIASGQTRGTPLLAHDPVTDAVIVGRNDATGFWVLNGKDCFQKPMPPFFVPFEHAPLNPVAWGISQIHDGSLMCGFALFNVSPIVTRICRFDIGRLKQTKLSEEIAGE